MAIRKRPSYNRRKGLSPVVSIIILSGVTLAIGSALWAYSVDASTWVAANYVDETMKTANTANERFMIEHVLTTALGDVLKVWVYNYGDLTVVVDVYVEVDDGNIGESKGIQIDPLESSLIEIDFSADPLEVGDYLVIKILSRRQNYVLENYMVE
jgi:hypothetical protein